MYVLCYIDNAEMDVLIAHYGKILERHFIQPEGLAYASFKQVAPHRPFMVALRDRYHHPKARSRGVFTQHYIPQRVNHPTLAFGKKPVQRIA